MDTLNYLRSLHFNTELFRKLISALFTSELWDGSENPVSLLTAVSSSLNVSSSTFIKTFVANSTYSEQQVISGLQYLRQCVNSTTSLHTNVNASVTLHQLESCFLNNPTSDKLVDCDAVSREYYVTWIGVIFSIFFLIFTSFLSKRKQFFPRVFNGKPGPVVPLNMLDHFEDRYGYAAAFGASTSKAVTTLFGIYTPLFGNKASNYLKSGAFPTWASVFIQILASVVVALAYYPFFVCLKRSKEILFCVIGLFFSIVWGVLTLAVRTEMYHCYIKQELLSYAAIFDAITELPPTFCVLMLLVIFIYKTILWIRNNISSKSKYNADARQSQWKETHLYQHVWTIINVEWKRSNKDEEQNSCDIKKKLYEVKPEFKYSLRVICAFFVGALSLYMLVSFLVFVGYAVFETGLVDWINSDDFKNAMSEVGLTHIISDIKMYIDVLRISYYVSAGIAAIIVGITFANMTALYRMHMLKLRKGDKAWLPKCVTKMKISRSSLTSSSMKFAGFQIGYIIWGYALIFLVLWLVMSVVGTQLLMPLIRSQSSLLLRLVKTAWPAAVISLFMNISQLLAAKFFFLHGRGTTFFINNRSAFHITSYFMFFFNIILGFVSSLLRIGKGVVIGVLFFARLQKSLLPRGFENQDPGYLAYIGYVVLEHAHTSPVLFVFTRLLDEDYRQKKQLHGGINYRLDESSKVGTELKVRSTAWVRSRNRWQLFSMLIANPSLISLRKHQQSEEVDREEEQIKTVKIAEKEIEILI